MNSITAIRQGIIMITYILAQVILLKNVVIFDMAFGFVYIGFLLLLPVDTDKILLLFIGFLLGILVDVFYDTLGIHTAACVLVAYLRPFYLNMLAPQGGYDTRAIPSVQQMGFQWFLVYASFFVLIHHITLFFIESGFKMFFFTLGKSIFSIIFSLVLLILVQYIFYVRRRNR